MGNDQEDGLSHLSTYMYTKLKSIRDNILGELNPPASRSNGMDPIIPSPEIYNI